ncbi:MAG: hypothetical protein IKH37_11015 [Prevotella sp.]|nr:hypothetical protein [Prevotella sp.]
MIAPKYSCHHAANSQQRKESLQPLLHSGRGGGIRHNPIGLWLLIPFNDDDGHFRLLLI